MAWHIAASVRQDHEGYLDTFEVEVGQQPSKLKKAMAPDPGQMVAIWNLDREMSADEAQQWVEMTRPSAVWLRATWDEYFILNQVYADAIPQER